MSQPSFTTPHTSYRPQPRPLGSHRSHPMPPARVLPRRLPRPLSQPPHRGAEGSREAKPAWWCCREEGTQGHGRRRVGAPSQPLPRHRAGVGSVPAAPQSRGPSAPAPTVRGSSERRQCPCSLPCRRLFPLSSLFFPPTPPRGAHREEEAQFPIVSVFLFIVLLGKTQRPANKHPFIRRPQCRGVQGKCRQGAGLRQPLGFSPRRRDGAHCSRRHQRNG